MDKKRKLYTPKTYRGAKIIVTKLLKELGLGQREIKLFYENCSKYKISNHIVMIYYFYIRHPYYILSERPRARIFYNLLTNNLLSFLWGQTPEGYDYWNHLIGKDAFIKKFGEEVRKWL